MSGMSDLTPTSLAAAVATQAKSLKIALVFLKEEKICYKMYTTLCIVFQSQNLSRRKTDFSEGHLKG